MMSIGRHRPDEYAPPRTTANFAPRCWHEQAPDSRSPSTSDERTKDVRLLYLPHRHP